MPAKKKRKGHTTDFERKKKKVGRAAPKAMNHTDTTVRARSIFMPDQSVVSRESEQSRIMEGKAGPRGDPARAAAAVTHVAKSTKGRSNS